MFRKIWLYFALRQLPYAFGNSPEFEEFELIGFFEPFILFGSFALLGYFIPLALI